MRWLELLLANALLACALVAGCSPAPVPVRPALWQVEARQGGGTAWLFGTVHALKQPVDWRSPAVARALDGADALVVEVAALDGPAPARAFDAVARTPGLPTLHERAGPDLRARLDGILQASATTEASLRPLETWAAAMTLANAMQRKASAHHGIDRALLASADGKPVRELEGAAAQFAIFDRLPEPLQRTLLRAIVQDGPQAGDEAARLAQAWGAGDIAAIETATRQGMLADPALREALLTGRNRTWASAVATMIDGGGKPFVAVGAAHMAGPDGLPAMLAARGYTVRRIQ